MGDLPPAQMPLKTSASQGLGSPGASPLSSWETRSGLGEWRHQGIYICTIPQCHLPAQGPLCRVQTGPLVLSETHSHVLRGHWLLRPSGLEHGWCPWLCALFLVCKSRNLKSLFPSEPQEVGLSKIMQNQALGPRAPLGLPSQSVFLSLCFKPLY